MRGENLWNRPTPEQAQILSLAAMIQGGKTSKGPDKGTVSKTNSSDSNSSNEASKSKERNGIKPWMLEAPKDGDPKTIIKNDKDYHWCPKCAKGAGQWVRHKPSEHSEDFRSNKRSNDTGDAAESAKKQDKRSFVQTGGNSSKTEDLGGTSREPLRFNQAALLLVAAGNNSDTQTFLLQFIPGNE